MSFIEYMKMLILLSPIVILALIIALGLSKLPFNRILFLIISLILTPFILIKYFEWIINKFYQESDKLSYYSSYVNHMMRLYYKTDGKDLRTDINKLNYDIAKRVIESFSVYEQAILTDILLPDRPIHKNVEIVSIEYNITEDDVWQLLNTVTDKIAEERGLI